jgi:hypothetical protein
MGQRGRGIVAGAAALLAIALLGVGVNGQEAVTSTPTVMDLVSAGVSAEGGGLIKEGLLDADGNAVGSAVWDCTNAEGVAWPCRVILSLEAGPSTSEGSIVLDGLFEGFSGESLAVTGGSGAYATVRGDATLTAPEAGFTWHLELAQ